MVHPVPCHQMLSGKLRRNTKSSITFLAKARQCTVGIANNEEKRKAAFRLLYRIYKEQGYAKHHHSGMWYSIHELLPTSVTISVQSGADTVASVTLASDSDFGIPADDVFAEHLQHRRERGQRLAEVMSLGIRRDLRSSEAILGKLFNFIYLIARYIVNASDIVITVVPDHARFYRKLLLFDQLEEVGLHRKTGAQCVLLSYPIDRYDDIVHNVRSHSPYAHFVPPDRERALLRFIGSRMRPCGVAELRQFLSLRPELLDCLPSEQYISVCRWMTDDAAAAQTLAA